MNYLAFRYTKVKYKVPIDFNDKVKRVNPEVVEEKLGGYKGASFLSGGLDSSLMAAINKPEVCYTAVFKHGFGDGVDWEGNELPYARRVAAHLNIPLNVVQVTRERYLSTLEHLIRHKGDGLHPNEPCLYLCAKKAREDGFDNIMSGEGADDLFGGYTDLLTNEDEYLADRETFLDRYCYINTDPNVPFKKWKRWGMYRFILEVHTPALIDRANNACKVAGINVEFPYLGNGIPQLMWEAPMGQKIDKPILKEIALKYLPKDIVYRKKIGFPTPWPVKDFLRLNKEIGW